METQNSTGREKIGLVLEGGAMRGMFTSGVLDVFIENNIFPDAAVGVSAGAVFGVNYIAGQKGRVIRYNKRFSRDKRYMGISSLLKTGNYVNADFAYGTMPRELDIFDEAAYEGRGVPFYAVVTNIETGKAEYIEIKDVFKQMDTLRASASMPFVSRPVNIGDGLYLDGGLADPIPVRQFIDMGYKKNIIILTRQSGYVKKPMNTAVIKLFYRKKRSLCETMECRHNIYNDSLKKVEELERNGEAFVIRPPVAIDIGRIERNPGKLQMVYDMGIRTGKERVESLKRYIQVHQGTGYEKIFI